jgi:putative transcriptional regulator
MANLIKSFLTFFTTIFFVIIISISLNGAAFCSQKIHDNALWSLLIRLTSTIPSDKRLAKGKFLVAARKLKDPNFSQSVVLLLDYDQNGAMGLIINQPTDMKLSMVFTDKKELQKRSDTIFLGGPVMRNQLTMLVRTGVQPEGSLRVFENVYVASQLELIEQIIKNEEKGDRFRVYAGYAGWAPGQLDQEAKRGDWHILPADADTVFNNAPFEIWPELIHRSSLKYVKIRGKVIPRFSYRLNL